MGNDIKALQAIVDQQETIAKKKRVAKALGLEFKHPSVRDQIHCKGNFVKDHKRGRAMHGRHMFVIPAVETANGRIIPAIAVEPHCAREVAFELLRLADSM